MAKLNYDEETQLFHGEETMHHQKKASIELKHHLVKFLFSVCIIGGSIIALYNAFQNHDENHARQLFTDGENYAVGTKWIISSLEANGKEYQKKMDEMFNGHTYHVTKNEIEPASDWRLIEFDRQTGHNERFNYSVTLRVMMDTGYKLVYCTAADNAQVGETLGAGQEVVILPCG